MNSQNNDNIFQAPGMPTIPPPPPDASIDEKITHVLDHLRPSLELDGGSISYEGFDSETGIARVKLLGACVGCPMSSLTLRWGVEESLMRLIPEVKGIDSI